MIKLATPKAVADCLAEFAPRLVGLEAVIQNTETCWTLGFDDDLAILLEWAAAPGRLVMSSELGQPAPGRQLQLAQAALAYNLLWQRSGGCWLGQGPDDKELLLLYEWHVGLFDSGELPTAIEHFAPAARWWIDQVKQVQGASGIDISAASVMLRA